MNIIDIQNIDILFGKNHTKALKLLKNNHDRAYIKKYYDVVVGVKSADLQIRAGEIFVLMGLSGSGKSTLLRAINGLIKPVRGDIVLFLENQKIIINSCSNKILRNVRQHHIAMVFQHFALLPWRSVEENVQLGLELAHASKIFMREKVHEMLNLVGLYEWRQKLPHELSGGMQQRVGLARSLATDAEMLLSEAP